MTETERAIAAESLTEKMINLVFAETDGLGDANEQGAIAMMAATATAVSFAAIRNLDSRATIAELLVLASSIAKDVHGGRE